MKKTFGNRLRDLRERRDFTQREVSSLIGCSCKVLSNYELDKREPDFQTLVKICDFFEVTTDYMLGRTEVAIHYKDIPLSSQSESLLTLYEKLPDDMKYDVIRYTKLNVLDNNLKSKE